MENPEPEPEPEPENANTYDNGTKVFFVVGGMLIGVTVAAGASMKHNFRRS